VNANPVNVFGVGRRSVKPNDGPPAIDNVPGPGSPSGLPSAGCTVEIAIMYVVAPIANVI
jgi:hypothetical protein